MTNEKLQARLREAIVIEAGLGNVWPIFGDPDLFTEVVEAVAAPYLDAGITKVAGVEARGFVLGAAVALRLRAGFVGIRKPGGWYPGDVWESRSPSDYRGNQFVLRLQKAAMGPTDKVILVDDWFETGGQASTALDLINQSGAQYMGSSIVVDWLSPEMHTVLAPVHGIVNHESLPTA